jgi:ubiquinone/menaquinone biosynthesis C-methylase UbiE
MSSVAVWAIMTTNLDSSRRFWDQKAKANPYWYISSYGPYEGRDLEEFWRSGLNIWKEIKTTIHYSPSSSDGVVEIGCGIGRLTRAIAPEVKEVFSFDISKEMLELARENVPSNVKLNLAEGTSLSPIPDACVDLALAYCVFQHLPSLADFESYLRAMVRVTKPGGIIAFTICARHWTWSLLPLMRLKGFMKSKLGLQPPDLYKKEWLGVRPSLAQIRSMCPVSLEVKYIGGGRTLLWGRV